MILSVERGTYYFKMRILIQVLMASIETNSSSHKVKKNQNNNNKSAKMTHFQNISAFRAL